MASNHLILCRPLLLLPSVFPSIRVFSNRLACRIRWPKYWNFSSSPSNKHSELISFKIDWFDLLAIQGMLKSLTQRHDLKASILQHSAFFTVQLSHPYLCVCVCVLVAQLCLTLCNTTDYSPTRLLCPWNSPGKNTGVYCHSLLQKNFPSQGSNPGLPRHRQILYCLSYGEACIHNWLLEKP